MSRNEKTSARVGRDAGLILLASPTVHTWRGHQCVRITLDMWERCQRVAGSAMSQRPDRRDDRDSQVRKALRGKLGKLVTGPARIKSKKPSSWPPSAKPKRGSP